MIIAPVSALFLPISGTVNSIMAAHDLTVFDVEELPRTVVHSGCFVKHMADTSEQVLESVGRRLEVEEEFGLFDFATYEGSQPGSRGPNGESCSFSSKPRAVVTPLRSTVEPERATLCCTIAGSAPISLTSRVIAIPTSTVATCRVPHTDPRPGSNRRNKAGHNLDPCLESER